MEMQPQIPAGTSEPDATHPTDAPAEPAAPAPRWLPHGWLSLPAVLGVAIASPLMLIWPRRMAGLLSRYFVLLPPALFLLLLAGTVYSNTLVAGDGSRLSLTDMAAAGAAMAAYLAVAWLLLAWLGAPLVSRWDEPAWRSRGRAGGMLLTCLLMVAAVSVCAEFLADAYIPLVDYNGAFWSRGPVYTLVEAGIVLLVWLGAIQTFRGVVSTGGGRVPSLEPLCGRCGYSLAGVVEIYDARRAQAAEPAAAEEAPLMCSECGADLDLSLHPASRSGTAWTRGEDLSLRSWRRSLRMALLRPGRFFADLPLAASREAAVRFWLLTTVAAVAAAGLILGIDTAVCAFSFAMEPLAMPGHLPAVMTPWEAMAEIAGQAVQFWFGLTAGIAAAVALLLASAAGSTGRQISKQLGRNMHPIGLLLFAYLWPVAMATGLVPLLLYVLVRHAAEAFLSPQVVHGLWPFLEDPDDVALLVMLISLLPVVIVQHLVWRRASAAIRHASR